MIQKLFKDLVWKRNISEKVIYLTFDDGPIPEITPWVLAQLNQYHAKATFFCVGENISKHGDIFKEIILNNHRVGNHTFNHLKGLKNSTEKYIQNIDLCTNQIQKYEESDVLFRPPHGRLKFSQMRAIRKKGFEIIMWDVLSADFDVNLNPEECLKKTIAATRNGSIVVFHDSKKAFERLKVALPAYLEHFSNLGYQFKAL